VEYVTRVMNMKLRCRLEELIKKSGLRKDYIAGKLEISTRQLRNYELEKSYMPMDKAYILADLLEVKVDELYERKEEEK
jgi:transcriptional regulator with XRE-family HTH domain